MIWVLLFFAALVLALPYIFEALKPRMDASARQSAPGEFVELTRGLTHYQWFGGVRGPIAVCVHGLTTPSFVWAPIVEGLVAQGFRVLTYDLYGRGYSDRPPGPQDSAFFVAQLDELLESQEVEGDITLLGYSMGGAIVTAYAGFYPEKLRRMVLLAPAGMGHDLGPVAQLVVNSPWLGSWLMLAGYARSFRRASEAERDLPSLIDNVVDLQQDELRYRGFVPAVMHSLRGILNEDLSDAHRDIAVAGIPVLAIWAREDEIIPISGLGTLAQWNRTARQEVIEGAGHTLAYTDTPAVLDAMHDLMQD